MAENQISSKDRLKEITDSIESGIKDLFDSDKYKQYLTTMSRFHKYSVNNTMLIYLQKPNATLVAGFNKWKDQFERSVMKGEKGIKIIAPTPYKKKIEQEKLDPDTRLPVLDADGHTIMEEKTVQIPMYKVVSVFDVAQTDGKPLPSIAADLAGNVQNYDVFMEALKRSAPVPIAFEAMQHDMDGYFSTDEQRIAIREGMSEVQTVSATVHEIAHSRLHNKDLPEVKDEWKLVMVSDGGTKKDFTVGYDTQAEAEAAGNEHDWQYADENQFVWRLEVEEDTSTAEFVRKSRNTEEVEAESVSFAVCAYYGIATGENSFGYIATWSKDKELSELRASLETINKTASGIITDIDRNYAVIMKERGLDKVEPELPVEEPAREALYLIADKDYLHIQYSEAGTWDYSIYDKDSLKLSDGGLLDEPDMTMPQARDALAGEYAFDVSEMERIPTERMREILDEISIAAEKQVLEATQTDEAPLGGGRIVDMKVETYDPNMTPAYPVGYPMPDPAISIEAMNAYGYTDGDMLPLSKDRAIELFERDVSVYMLYEGNGAGMAFDADDIEAHTGIFGVTREEWDEVRDSIPAINPQEQQRQLESRFLENTADNFAIYQLKRGDETAELRFMSSDYLNLKGLEPEHENYDLVYTDTLNCDGSTGAKLEEIYRTFNIDHPEDFRGHSLSVSDIVALKQDGVVSCHYVDSVGFTELSSFIRPENYLKSTEMAVEDDYGMIDGIVNNGSKQLTVAELEQQAKTGTPISLMDLADAIHREKRQELQPQDKQKRPSVLAQLRTKSTDPIKTNQAPIKSAEREL